jgi:membrane-associated protein
MSGVGGLHGAIAVLLICGLVFIEESGVPLPMLPGDGLLVALGVLAANHAVDAHDAVPALCIAAITGALLGYGWARAIGRQGLDALARRLRAGELIDRAGRRLRAAGAGGIVVCRLLPGLRVYSSLVAGATGMEPRVFVAGLVPAVVIWVVGFVALGYAVGVPAEHLLSHGQQVALNAVVILGLALGAYVGVRHIPARERGRNALAHAHRPWRLGIALTVDATIVAGVIAALTDLVHDTLGWGDPDGLIDFGLVALIVTLAYVAAARVGTGGTAGESVLGLTYRRVRHALPSASSEP